jgi:hypothetical protein
MAVQKKRVTKKTKKEIVKKKMSHKVVTPEIEQDVPKAEQTPVLESGVLQDTPKEKSQSEPELPKIETQQVADTLVSQPASVISNDAPSTETIATQDPFAVDGVVRDKPEEDIEEPKKKRSWIVIILIIVVVIFIVGVLWYFRENAIKQISVKDAITSTPSPSKISPTPASDSAKLAIDYSKYKIKVLNGSGIGGAAAKGKEIIESEKFIVEEISNAETSDYKKTVIQAKKEVPSAFLDKLKSVLKETYLLDVNEELEDSEEVDVVIIIGSGRKP